MRVEIVPASADDVQSIVGKPDWRVRGLAAKLNGEVLGVGGVTYLNDGTVGAFVAMKPEARKYPVAIHRAGLKMVEMFKSLGLHRVVALADENIEPAERWLMKLGFEPVEVNGAKAFVWKNK